MLPELTRAGTFEIEMHYFMKHLRHHARKPGKLYKTIARGIGKILKCLAFAPYLPRLYFFILADKLALSTKHETTDKSTEEPSDEIIYFSHPEYSDDGNPDLHYNDVLALRYELEPKL
ncbi:hypothetical protein F4814DRAFT_377502 [Daldinia grandis]|nr:hypothetical protein F4814DRAFT_377502 [Daldinia grandis]